MPVVMSASVLFFALLAMLKAFAAIDLQVNKNRQMPKALVRVLSDPYLNVDIISWPDIGRKLKIFFIITNLIVSIKETIGSLLVCYANKKRGREQAHDRV